ncbi:hypothetical protein CLU79DRAFT_777650 [Phycomyces nitens]|nr:hypothetical protein CLU79DRAFT_777650 [Phycomyces nitens]
MISAWTLRQLLSHLQSRSQANTGLKNVTSLTRAQSQRPPKLLPSPSYDDNRILFFSSRKLSLLSSEYRDDPTLKTLYSIAKEQTMTNVPVEKSTTERLRAYADGGTLYTQSCKHVYTRKSDVLIKPMPSLPNQSDSSENLVDQTSSSIDRLRAEIPVPKTDTEYIHQFKQSKKK